MKKHKLDMPYVVSADLAILVSRWCKNKGFACPDQSFFDELRGTFSVHMKTMFPNFNFISELELREGFLRFSTMTRKFPLVSLERVYDEKTPETNRFDCCRVEACSPGVVMARSGTDIGDQLESIENSIGCWKDIALWDDVAFSGSSVLEIIELLKRGPHLSVEEVFLGIGVQVVDGLRGGCIKFRDAGVAVNCIREYEQVIDQVCERDFYPGVLFGGRSVRGNENFSCPYLRPWGDPQRWASIPKNCERKFSRFCIKLAIRLFEEVERLSRRRVYARDLERRPFHFRKGKPSLPRDSVRHIDILKRVLEIVG